MTNLYLRTYHGLAGLYIIDKEVVIGDKVMIEHFRYGNIIVEVVESYNDGYIVERVSRDDQIEDILK